MSGPLHFNISNPFSSLLYILPLPPLPFNISWPSPSLSFNTSYPPLYPFIYPPLYPLIYPTLPPSTLYISGLYILWFICFVTKQFYANTETYNSPLPSLLIYSCILIFPPLYSSILTFPPLYSSILTFPPLYSSILTFPPL